MGEGAGVSDLPTEFGHLTFNARQEGSQLHVVLGPGLREDIAVQVAWPARNSGAAGAVAG